MNNPFSYFERYINYPDLLKDGCYAFIEFSYEQNLLIDHKMKIITYDEVDEVHPGVYGSAPITVTFLERAKSEVNLQRIKALEIISGTIDLLAVEQSQTYLLRLDQKLEYLLVKCSEHFTRDKELEILPKALDDILKDLRLRYKQEFNVIDKGRNVIPSNVKAIEHLKPLVWNGPVSKLATLFHDLRTEYITTNKTPYLNYEPKILVDFIMSNFVDENKQSLSKSTIETYLNPKKKKAKINPIKLSSK